MEKMGAESTLHNSKNDILMHRVQMSSSPSVEGKGFLLYQEQKLTPTNLACRF